MAKVIWHTMVSLDGFISGLDDARNGSLASMAGQVRPPTRWSDRRERCWLAGVRRMSRIVYNRVSTAAPFAGRSGAAPRPAGATSCREGCDRPVP